MDKTVEEGGNPVEVDTLVLVEDILVEDILVEVGRWDHIQEELLGRKYNSHSIHAYVISHHKDQFMNLKIEISALSMLTESFQHNLIEQLLKLLLHISTFTVACMWDTYHNIMVIRQGHKTK